MTPTRYARSLDAEVGRLRAENRALLNSILGIAGIPPVVTGGSEPTGMAPEELPRIIEQIQAEALGERLSGESRIGFGLGRLQKATPTRGRSWRQISHMLELEALRKMRRRTDNGTDIAVPTRRNQPPREV